MQKININTGEFEMGTISQKAIQAVGDKVLDYLQTDADKVPFGSILFNGLFTALRAKWDSAGVAWVASEMALLGFTVTA